MVHQEMTGMQQRIVQLEAQLHEVKKDKKKEKELTDMKGFEKLGNFSGNEKEFGDWEFRLHQFIRPFQQFEAWLEWVKDLDEEVTMMIAADKAE